MTGNIEFAALSSSVSLMDQCYNSLSSDVTTLVRDKFPIIAD